MVWEGKMTRIHYTWKYYFFTRIGNRQTFTFFQIVNLKDLTRAIIIPRSLTTLLRCPGCKTPVSRARRYGYEIGKINVHFTCWMRKSNVPREKKYRSVNRGPNPVNTWWIRVFAIDPLSGPFVPTYPNLNVIICPAI